MNNVDCCPSCGITEFKNDNGKPICMNCGRIVTEEEIAADIKARFQELHEEPEILWCYGLSESGKWYGNEVYNLEERWEAVEKGEELARHEGLSHFCIGIVCGEDVTDIKKIAVRQLPTEDERMDVSELNSKYKRPRYHPSSVSK